MNDKLVVTDIKLGVKNQNRANVFLNHKFAFSLDLSQIIDFKIKLGSEFKKYDIEKFKHASDFGKLYQRMLEWTFVRPRSVREASDHLKIITARSKSDFVRTSQELKADVMERLISKGYLDDEKFAKYYVENRFTKKGISKKRLKLELFKKGVDRSIVDAILDEGIRSDEEEIKKIIAKKRARYDDEKLISYLVRQGFDFELARNLVQASSETD